MTPRSPTRMLARHCDRYDVTLASPGRTRHAVGPAPARWASLKRPAERPQGPEIPLGKRPKCARMATSGLRCLIRRPVVSCAAQTNRCAPQQGLHIGTWVAGARLLAPDLALSRLLMRPPSAGVPTRPTRPGGAP